MEEPTDSDWEYAFGVLPQRDSGLDEAWVRAVVLAPTVTEELRLSWDMLAVSTRLGPRMTA